MNIFRCKEPKPQLEKNTPISDFLNQLTGSKVKLIYKKCDKYYVLFLLVGPPDELGMQSTLKARSMVAEHCTFEINDIQCSNNTEVEGWLNAASVNTYIIAPKDYSSIDMWRITLIINDTTYVINVDSEPSLI